MIPTIGDYTFRGLSSHLYCELLYELLTLSCARFRKHKINAATGDIQVFLRKDLAGAENGSLFWAQTFASHYFLHVGGQHQELHVRTRFIASQRLSQK